MGKPRQVVAARREKRSRYLQALGLLLLSALVLSVVVLPFSHSLPYGVGMPGAIAQQPRQSANPLRPISRDVWQQVYERLPDFPLENNYVSKESGKVDPDNTLASRLLVYHIFVKKRPPLYRLDWKLTLADYLGNNEVIDPENYPGWDLLEENPIEQDKAVIAKLNRTQRDALIQVLVTIFDPNYNDTAETPEPRSTPSSPPPTRPSGPPPLPQPGDADLLNL